MAPPPPPPAPQTNITHRDLLKGFTAESVVNALTNGKMQAQGTLLNDAQKRLVAEYVTGKRFDPAAFAAANTMQVVNRCSVDAPMRPVGSGASWNGFGNGAAGTRFQPASAAELSAADLPRLKLKWAFGYANVSAARAQPTYAGGRLSWPAKW
jgi:polyvinyl alcohol dehydrogenase (cytochrome)